MSAGHELCLDVGVKERSIRYGDRQEISDLVTEQRMLCAGTEQFSFDDFLLGNEPEFVSEGLSEKHRELFFIFLFDEQVQSSRLDRRKTDETLHDLRIVEDAEILTVHMTVVGNDK